MEKKVYCALQFTIRLFKNIQDGRKSTTPIMTNYLGHSSNCNKKRMEIKEIPKEEKKVMQEPILPKLPISSKDQGQGQEDEYIEDFEND